MKFTDRDGHFKITEMVEPYRTTMEVLPSLPSLRHLPTHVHRARMDQTNRKTWKRRVRVLEGTVTGRTRH